MPTQEAAQRAEAIAAVYTAKVKNLLQVAPDKPAPSLAETYAALINETWGGQGIAARVMDPQTIALTGTYTPPAQAADAPADEPAVTDDLTGTDDAPPPAAVTRGAAGPGRADAAGKDAGDTARRAERGQPGADRGPARAADIWSGPK